MMICPKLNEKVYYLFDEFSGLPVHSHTFFCEDEGYEPSKEFIISELKKNKFKEDILKKMSSSDFSKLIIKKMDTNDDDVKIGFRQKFFIKDGVVCKKDIK